MYDRYSKIDEIDYVVYTILFKRGPNICPFMRGIVQVLRSLTKIKNTNTVIMTPLVIGLPVS